MPNSNSVSKKGLIGFVELTILFTSFIAATYGFGVYLFSTVLPDMKAELLFSYTEAGGMISVAQIGFLFAALSSGMLTHKIGARKLILLSMFACCISLLGMIFATQSWQVAVLLTIAGAAAAAVWVPMVAVAQDLIPAKHQGKAIGLMSSGTAYGVFVNGLAVPILLPDHGWRSVWLFDAAISCVSFAWGWIRLPALKQPQPIRESLPNTENSPSIAISVLIRQPSSMLILMMMFLNGIACMPAQNYLMSYLREDLGYEIATATRAWSMIGLIGMIGGFTMGALADKISVQKSLTVTYVLLGVATGLFMHHRSPYEVYIGAAIFGLAFNAIFGLVPAFVSLNFPKNTATLIFGLATVLLGLGSMIGNFFGGLVHDFAKSFAPVYQISTAMALILAILSTFLSKFSRTNSSIPENAHP